MRKKKFSIKTQILYSQLMMRTASPARPSVATLNVFHASATCCSRSRGKNPISNKKKNCLFIFFIFYFFSFSNNCNNNKRILKRSKVSIRFEVSIIKNYNVASFHCENNTRHKFMQVLD